MYAGVDLGGTNIACAFADAGRIVVEKSIPTQSNDGPQTVLARIAGLVRELAAHVDTKVSAVGIGIPGLVDREHGCTRFLPNLPTQWRDVPVAEMLSPGLGCPVFLLNDARLATLGELVFGRGRSVSSMLFFTLGTGVGGGIVMDGKLRLGPLGGAGEIGHQTIIPDGLACGCGSRGCLETLASGPAIAAEGVRLMKSGLAPKLFEIAGGNAAAVGPGEMARAAAAGDTSIRDAILRAARYLGIGAANLVTSLDLELIVLGGGVAAIGDLLTATVRAEICQRVRMFPVDGIRVERSLLGDKAGVWGGIALAMRGGAI